MTIQIELNPEMEAQLMAQANSRGLEVERYAQSLLREAMAAHSPGRSRASQQEFSAFLDDMASGPPPLRIFARRDFRET